MTGQKTSENMTDTWLKKWGRLFNLDNARGAPGRDFFFFVREEFQGIWYCHNMMIQMKNLNLCVILIQVL